MSSTRELEARKVGAVTANMSMSLDGYVEGPAGPGDVAEVFGWYAAGPSEVEMPGDARSLRTSEASARHLEASVRATGALITGRRLFDLTRGWGGRHPAGCPVFVVTHTVPEGWAHADAPFTFVLDGVASAVAQAQSVAGESSVAIASADIARQCLELGLLDAIAVDLVPVLLGGGKPFFVGSGGAPHRLEDPTVTEGQGVTHLHYRVRRGAER